MNLLIIISALGLLYYLEIIIPVKNEMRSKIKASGISEITKIDIDDTSQAPGSINREGG